MVERDEQQVVVGREPEERRAQERPLREIERPRGLLRRAAPRGRLPLGRGEPREVDEGEGPRLRRAVEALDRAAVDGVQRGAQDLVPPDHLRDRAGERLRVERAAQAERRRHVVRGALRLELIEEPEPLLRERERHLALARRGRDRPGRRARAPLGLPLDERGEPGDGRRLEDRPDGDVDAEHVAEAGRRAGGRERVPADREEVVVRADALDPEDGAPHLGDRLLEAGARRRPRREIARGAPRGRGQRLAVDLAVRAQRRVERDDRRGDHVRRQARRELLLEGARIERRGLRDHVRDEPRVARRVLAGDHDDIADPRAPRGRRLDLAELDAELDLVVDPPEEHELAARQAPHQVAGPVQARARAGRERIRQERRRGALGVVEVAPADADAADVELAGDAERHGPPPPIEHVELRVLDREADRHVRRVLGRGLGEDVLGDVVRALRRAVGVHQRDLREEREPPPREIGRERLAGEDEPPQALEARPEARARLQLVERPAQERRHDLQDGDAEVAHRLEEARRVGRDLVRHEPARPAREQGAEQLPHRDVEADRRGLRDDVRRPEPEGAHLREEVVQHPPVLDHRALGRAGRSRREDDVGEVLRPRAGRRFVGRGRAFGEQLARRERLRRGGARGDDLVPQRDRDRVAHEEGRAARAREDVGVAPRRVRRVERHVRARRLEGPEREHQEIEIAARQQGDKAIRADAARRERARDLIGEAVELRVGEPEVAAGGGEPVGRPGGLLPEEVVEAGAFRDGRRGVVAARDQVPLLVRREQRELVDRPVRILGGGAEEHLQVAGHALDLVAREAVLAVLERGRELAALAIEAGHAEPQVELRGALHGPVRGPEHGAPQRPLGPRGRLRDALQHEARLDQRVPLARAPGAGGARDLVERQLGVLHRLGHGPAHAADELAVRRPAGEIDAQDDRVREEADDLLVLGAAPVGDDDADPEVLLPGRAVEQRRVHGGEGDEERRVLRPRGGERRLDVRRGQREPDRPAGEGRRRRAPSLGAEVEPRQPLELRLPVRPLRVHARERGPLRARVAVVPGGR
ncbi:hypothetical protein BE20_03765, partial [Sorangium cellulosum]